MNMNNVAPYLLRIMNSGCVGVIDEIIEDAVYDDCINDTEYETIVDCANTWIEKML